MLLSLWRAATRGTRDSLSANLVPALLLQTVAVAIVASYYGLGSTRALWDSLAQWKHEHGGLPLAAASTSFFAALLPYALSRLARGSRHEAWRHLPWLMLFWGFMGCVLDRLYAGLAALFGDNMRPATLAAKVVADEFVFTPLFSMPLVTLAYAWKDSNYNWARTLQVLGAGWYVRRVLPLLATSWVIWIPAIALVYALPLPLQLPVENLVQCLWSLFLLFLTQPRPAEGEASPS